MSARSQKTNICLGESNLAAVLLAFKAVKACLGQQAQFSHLVLKQENKNSSEYVVKGRVLYPLIFSNKTREHTVDVSVKLSIVNEPAPHPTGSIVIEHDFTRGVPAFFLSCTEGTLVVNPETERDIKELFNHCRFP